MFTNTNIHDELGDDFTAALREAGENQLAAAAAAALPDTPPHYR